MTSNDFHRLRPRKLFTVLSEAAILLALFMMALGSSGRITAAVGPHGTVELVAERTSVQAGRPFWVGLHFQLEPGWHIYWINPGDSGQPPRVKWSLPAGLEAGPLQWPLPQRIEDHSLIDYGYQNSVLLPVRITPAAGLHGEGEAPLQAAVRWLVCRDICLPGRAVLELTLPVQSGAPAPSPQHSLFSKSQAEVPQPAPKTWNATARLEAHRIVLNILTGRRQTSATFFPLEPNQIENAAPAKASPVAGGIQITLQKSDQMLKSPARIAGVLVFPSRQGYVIQAPVITSP